MAYMSQDKKSEIVALAKPILKKYGIKGSFSVDNGSGIRLKIKSGPIDFIKNYNETVAASPGGFRYNTNVSDNLSVNPYWYRENFSGLALSFLKEILVVMNRGNHDNSNSQIDYFDIGWYVYVDVGTWNKPYILEK